MIRNKFPRSEAIRGSSSYESILSELQILRQKYDAVVDYTVHLTAERDSLVKQLEDTKAEEGGGKKMTSSPSRKGEKSASERKIQQVYRLHIY
jgi:regulator of replication initiation timing